jgi:hypothetical protein
MVSKMTEKWPCMRRARFKVFQRSRTNRARHQRPPVTLKFLIFQTCPERSKIAWFRCSHARNGRLDDRSCLGPSRSNRKHPCFACSPRGVHTVTRGWTGQPVHVSLSGGVEGTVGVGHRGMGVKANEETSQGSSSLQVLPSVLYLYIL